MTKNPIIYLNHILNCTNKIIEYTKDLNEKSFLENSLIQDAVIRNLEIIGEATKKINDDFKNKYPEFEWKKMAGMRDKLIHDYIGVDIWAVWRVVEKYIPTYNSLLQEIIEQEDK